MGFGTLREVKEMNAREVLQALNYDSFLNDYEFAYVKMNSSEV